MPSSAPDATLEPVTVPVTRKRRRPHRDVRLWLLVLYAIALTLIAFWPVPVDRGVDVYLADLTARIPWLTYDAMEVGANVLVFVPLGILLTMVLPFGAWWFVIPIAFVVTVTIEVVQAQFLDDRTFSVRDVIANLTGLVIACLLEIEHRRRMRR